MKHSLSKLVIIYVVLSALYVGIFAVGVYWFARIVILTGCDGLSSGFCDFARNLFL